MNDFYGWASSQPIWLQVVIGLIVFFVGIPLILLTVWLCILAFALVLGRIIAVLEFFFAVCMPPILFPIALFTIGYLVWEISEITAWELAFATRSIFGSSPTQIEATFQWLTAFIAASIFLVVSAVLYFKRQSLLPKIWKLFSPRPWPRENLPEKLALLQTNYVRELSPEQKNPLTFHSVAIEDKDAANLDDAWKKFKSVFGIKSRSK